MYFVVYYSILLVVRACWWRGKVHVLVVVCVERASEVLSCVLPNRIELKGINLVQRESSHRHYVVDRPFCPFVFGLVSLFRSVLELPLLHVLNDRLYSTLQGL